MMVPDWFFLGIRRWRWRIWITVTYGQWYKTDYGSAIGQHMDSTCIQRQSSTFIINTLSAIKGAVPFHLSLAMLFLIFVTSSTTTWLREPPSMPTQFLHLQPINKAELMQRHNALSHHLEYYLRLPYYHLFVYLGCRTSQHPVSKEASGEQLYWKMEINPFWSFAEHRLLPFVCAGLGYYTTP